MEDLQTPKNIQSVSMCYKCGKTGSQLIHHHITYVPDKTVLCCWSCHQKIHNKVREQKTCPLTTDEVNELSRRSSHKRKAKDVIRFRETLAQDVLLVEGLYYNPLVDDVRWRSGFEGNHGNKLYYFDEDVQLRKNYIALPMYITISGDIKQKFEVIKTKIGNKKSNAEIIRRCIEETHRVFSL